MVQKVSSKPEVEQTSDVDKSHQDPAICGIIMPISATVSHSETHWSDVQILLHRAIAGAGFKAANVWENTATDRVSERIIANIFEYPIVVADISDLNPNVMLELGLRLASKKPTVVIINSGQTIPFDIRDFHVLSYPADMNMLGMEKFFGELRRALAEKYTAFMGQEYQPFLGKIVVDVITPGQREVTADVAIVDMLAEITARLSSIERNNELGDRTRLKAPTMDTRTMARGRELLFTVTGDLRKAQDEFLKNPGVMDVVPLAGTAKETFISVRLADCSSDEFEQIRLELMKQGKPLGCVAGISKVVTDQLGL